MSVAFDQSRHHTSDNETRHWHTVGIGAGPSNLSLAALLEEVLPDQVALFEQQSTPAWHPGLLLPNVRMQTTWIKDLVSLVAPTHHLSFLQYLVEKGRIFHFLNAQMESIPRREFSNYLQWAAHNLNNVHFGTRIDGVGFEGDRFALHSDGRKVATCTNLVFGMGNTARLPTCLEGLPKSDVTVADHLMGKNNSALDRDSQIAVIGSGQTAAEATLYLYNQGFTHIRWIGKRQWFAPLDDSPTANELFRPAYEEYLHTLPRSARPELITEQNLASNGVSMETLLEIFRINYEHELEFGHSPIIMHPNHEVIDSKALSGGGVELVCSSRGGGHRSLTVSHVVVGAGRVTAPLPLLSDLEVMIEYEDGLPILEADYALRWKGSDQNKMFAMNRGRYSHGLADSNLSLTAVRSATVVNALCEREVYPIRDYHSATVWGRTT